MEQLKKNVDEQQARDKMAEVALYIDGLMFAMRAALKDTQRSTRLELAAFVVILIAAFSTTELFLLAWMLWLFTMVRGIVAARVPLVRIKSELDGAFKTLVLLGFIDSQKNIKRTKRRRKNTRNKYAGLVAKWGRAKSKMRDGFATACVSNVIY